MNKINNKFVYWTPRILSIILVLFLSMFSLDVFEENLSFLQTFLALLIHNIPTIILAIIIWISWKYEIVGGIFFMLAAVAHTIFSITRVDAEPWYVSLASSMVVGLPAILIGILFLIGWVSTKRGSASEKIIK